VEIRGWGIGKRWDNKSDEVEIERREKVRRRCRVHKESDTEGGREVKS